MPENSELVAPRSNLDLQELLDALVVALAALLLGGLDGCAHWINLAAFLSAFDFVNCGEGRIYRLSKSPHAL